MPAWITAALGIIKTLLGIGQSQADANAAAVQKQGGVDAQRSAELAAQVKTVQAENKALVNAPSDEAGTIDAMKKGDVLMTEQQIKHMVDRFLSWKLPDGFRPDGGITFEPLGNAGTPYEYRHQPVGTNLFDATQAGAMVRYLLEGLPE